MIPVLVPPLRERPDDVLPLARAFLERCNEEQGRDLRGWTEEAERWLLSHDWPGNVRELENTIERAVVLARGDRLELAELRVDGPAAAVPEQTLQGHLDTAARAHIRGTLAAVGGKRVEAARRLGVERRTLYRLMQKYGIE